MLEELQKRGVPTLPLLDENGRRMVTDLLCREEYGFLPPPPRTLHWTVEKRDESYCAGKAVYQRILLEMKLENGAFSFPVDYICPVGAGKHPAVVSINFSPNTPNEYLPVEEIVDYGFALAAFHYEAVTSDNEDFSNGLARIVYYGQERPADGAGKITLWAWAAMRVLDFLLNQSEIAPEHIAVAGHSRLGKTALFASAMDTRFQAVCSNDSGCAGAAISRGKIGESTERICRVFPHWFCKNFASLCQNPEKLLFDQHFLLALTAPRLLYVTSAEEDSWADPDSEYLGCMAASPAWKAFGKSGFLAPDRPPKVHDRFPDGNIGYHLRPGCHYFSRRDWQGFLEFLIQKGWR